MPAVYALAWFGRARRAFAGDLHRPAEQTFIQATPMTHTSAAVQPNSFLTLHYRLSGPAGDVINTFDGSPATLTMGSGQLAPALESHLLGLAEGTRTHFELAAGAVFGQRSADMQQWLAHQALAEMGVEGGDLAVGEVLQIPTPTGQGHFAATVLQLRNDERGQAVLLDFNHPLAGQPLHFEVHVIGVL